MSKITILDSTLREGAQSESISYSDSDKIKILQLLDKLGIDFAECGNPGANEKDLKFYTKLKNIKFDKLKVVPFGSTCRKNTLAKNDSGLNSLLKANTEYVTIFGKSSLLHVTDVLKVPKQENLRMIEESVKFLSTNGKKVFYDAEHFFDGYKYNKEYAIETLMAASKGGAELLVLCDTNGGNFPSEIEEIFKYVIKIFDNKKIGIHCHNDCGLAIANTLIGINNGAYQAQCTVGGVGERCGNADLCTLLPLLQLKMGYNIVSDEQLSMLTRISRNIFELLNLSLSSKAPFIGKSAFTHKGGMHIDGVLKNNSSFEHIDPKLVGNQRRILISDQSGKTSVYDKLKEIIPHIDRNSEEVKIITDMIKKHSQIGYSYENADASFEIDALKALGMEKKYFKITDYHVLNGSLIEHPTNSQVYLKVTVGDKEEINAAEGDGPVNAIDNALRKALRVFYPSIDNIHLSDFKVRVVDNIGTASTVRVLIESTDGTKTWTTAGVSSNIMLASIKALEDAANYYFTFISKENSINME